MNPDKRDELYNNLINSGKVSEAEIGSLDDFKAAITDEASARLFHQNLMGSGIFSADEIGSEDDFYSSISSDFAGTAAPQQPATPAAQGLPVNPATFAPMAPAAPSSGAVNVRAPFVNEEAQRQYEQQKPTSPTQPTNPAAAQNEQEQPLGPERFAKQMQMEQQLGQMSQDFTNRMEAIRKGNQPFGSGHQREFNPETGRMEDVYYTKAGERTNTPLAQWEENNKGLRLQQDIDQSLSALDGAAEAAWKTATEASGKEQSENIKMIARTGGFMPGGSGMGQLAMLNTASHLKYHDLQRMADDAWNSLGIVKQQAMIDGIYNTLRSHHYNDEASDEQLRAEAEAMARQENDRRLFDYAVKMNAPKDATDYFFRKALQNNAITMLKDFAARSMAGTTGDWEARDVAEQQYDKESLGHNLIGHAGGITGFLLDPTVLIGGAAAKGAVGGATKIVGRLAAKRGGAAWVAEKAPTLIGKTTTGVVAGAGNFGTFESAQEALRQLRWGGKIEIDEKTGRYKIDGYDLGEVAKKYGHGALMGGTIGVLGPLTGNVGDRLVGYINKTGKPGTVANIMDKLGARTVQTGVCKTAEGTIFSIPEWIDTYKKYGEMIDAVSDPESKNYIADDYQRAKKIEELKAERAAEVMDTWTENEKMMLGFGLQHMVKSIPQRITELRDIDNARTMEERNHNRRDWLSKLNRMLDGRPDLALTRDEKDELQRRGYTDLADLVSEYKRWEEEKAVTEKARPDAIDASRMIGEGEDAAIPYNRFLQLMEDPTVSEAARAKMYYYLTGRQAPMSTVMGWSPIEEVKDANGKVTGYNVKSLGAKGVITSRTFADKAAAEAELQKIYRQAELNTLDIGERYYEGRGLSSEDLRDYVGKRHGVDVDASIRKDPNRRSKAEQEAVDEYTERLYVGVKTEEAYQRGYDADEQGRQDAMMELAMSDPSDPDHAEKQAAVDGINQRINDDADMQVAQQREAYNLQRNDDDGSLHPATMTVDGQEREVYIKSGLITTGADGSIDIENSGETIVVYDPVEGKNKMVSPADIRSLGDVTTAEQFEADLQNQRADYVKQQQDAATGRFDPQPGQEIDMPDGGKAVVLATDGESVTLQMPDGTQQSMAIADIQQIADGVMMEDYRQRHPDTAAAEQPAVEAPAMTEGKPETFEPNMELTIKDGEGEKIVYVTGTRARWNPTVGYVEDPNGKFVELYDPEANDGNGGMTYIREDDPDGKIVGHKPMEQPAAEQTETPAETTEQAPEQPTENEQPTEAPTEEVQQPEPAASSIMPMKKVREKRNVLDENGNPVKDENGRNKKEWVEEEVEDWYAATPEDAYTYLYDEAVAAGLDEKDADGIVKLMQEQSQKELADVKKKPEPVAGSVMATLQLRKERNAETEEAQSHVDYWKQVQSLRNRALLERKEAEASERRANETEEQKAKREAFEAEQARRQAEAETAERRRKEEDEQKANGTFEAPVKNTKITEPIEGVKTSESPLAAAKRELADDTEAMEMLNNTEPQTLEEIASTLLRSGKNQVGIIPEDFYKHTGFSAADAKSMNFILSNSGVSMSRLGEMVEAAARNENIPFDENYANAGLDAVLAVLGNVRTQGDINSYITNNRIRQAYDYHDKMLSMEEDLWIEAHDGLTRAEYDAWEHSIEEDAAALNGQKYEDYYNKIAESTLNNYYDTGSETNDGRGPEAGTGTLQGQEGLQTTDTRDGSRRAEGSGSREKRGPAESAVAGRIAAAEAQTDTNPTEAQKKAGNYAKGHLTLDGYNISIEQPKGSIRRGTDPNGHAWEQEMHNTYGYIRGTEGVDGDHIDVFLSDDPTQGNVFVIDQVNKDGSFDEHKVMYGFPDAESARAAYLSNYEDGWQGLGTITQVSKDEFKKWVESSHRKTKPFSEYKSVKPEGDVMVERQPSTAEDVEAGGAVVDRLQSMGVEVSTDIAENRKVRKQAEQDNSESGKIHNLKTSDGKVYGFTYRGKLYLDPRKIDAELPLHEYGHLWTEAFRRLNPEGWNDLVETMKQDAESWNIVKQLYPDLKTDSEIADEVIATFSGKNGAAKLKEELDSMADKNPDYKSRWGNIYNNIVKAIQDFWKTVGDFLGIKYESPEQVYDQVLRDFASGMNPRARVEKYLKERDAEYMNAVESGDEAKAKELFNAALRENIGNGVTPFVAVGGYRGNMDRLARGVKSRDPKVIAEVADLMAPLIPENAVLVPTPSHSGTSTDMLDVANAISERTGAPVADVLRSEERKSQYEAKRQGQPITSAQMGIHMDGELPEGMTPVVIDNVVNTGNTAEACVKALGKGVVVSLADVANRYRHVASLKSANPIARDKNGKVVPLSQRFDLGGSNYLAKQKGMPAAPTAEQKMLTKGLVGWLNNIGIKTHAAVRKGQEVLNKYREMVRALRGYHGSGADFDRFDHSHMGEGEGNQAYGYGTYVTEVEGIGRKYAKAGASTDAIKYKGMKGGEVYDRADESPEYDAASSVINSILRGKTADIAIKDAIEFHSQMGQNEMVKEIRKLSPSDFTISDFGILYTVEIPDDNGSNYLRYDKPATDEQIDRIKNALLSNDKFKEDSREEYDFMSSRLGDVQYIPPFEEWMDNRAGVIAMGAKERGQRVYDEIAKLLDSEKKASELLHAAGFVGIKYPAEYRSGGRSDGAKNYVIFDEGDLKITDKIRFQRAADGEYEPKLVFYSNAMNAVEGIKQEKATAEQWLAMLQKNGGLKAGEDKWIGLSDWLNDHKGKSLTKQEVMDYIKENQIEVEEVEYSDAKMPGNFASNLRNELNKKADEICGDVTDEYADKFAKAEDFSDELDDIEDEMIQEARRRLDDEFGVPTEHYISIQFENDRNRLVYTPTRSDRDFSNNFAQQVWNQRNGNEGRPINETRLQYTTDGLENKREIALTVPTVEPWNEGDEIHFGDAGEGRAVAWVRFGETTMPSDEQVAAAKAVDDYLAEMREKYGSAEGVETDQMTEGEIAHLQSLTSAEAEAKNNPGKRVLVIDEIQSKRHQEGREKGYIVNPERKALLNWYEQKQRKYGVERHRLWEYLTEEEDEELTRLQDEARLNSSGNSTGIPDAPFDRNWHELAMKRMLRYAAENGYDKVAWTTGEQQANRYDLSKSIKDMTATGWTDYSAVRGDDAKESKLISINTIDGGEYAQLLVDKSGKVISDVDDQFVGKQLSDIVGKDLAKRLMEDGYQTIEGEGLRIGGEGMKGFYDQILPRFMDKYGKKWNVKTTDINLPNIGDNGLVMHSIDVTPEMKASVLEGQPMFFKGEDGEVLGFTLNGEIYIDPRYAKPETPVHEYAHLIVHAIRANNPKVWERWKQLAHGEQDVIDFVKAKYPEYSENEDDFWEEVIANYTGREGGKRLEDEMSRQMRETPDIVEKARIATIFHKLRDLLKRFWEITKDIFAGNTKGIDNFKSMDDVVDLTLAALANKFDPRTAQRAAEEKTLMGVHNISEEKLKKALKKGGFANPSMVVIDTKNGGFDSYGDISLIPKASLIDSRSGRNAGTYGGDAWTPTYPGVEYYEGKETAEKLKALTAGLPESLGEYIRRRVSDYMDKNYSTSGLEYLFLKEHGIDMPIAHNKRRYPNISNKEIYERIGVSENIYGSDLYKEYEKMPQEQLFDFNLWLDKYGDAAEIAKVNDMIARLRGEGKDEAATFLIDRYSKPMTFANFDSHVHNVGSDEREAGSENLRATIENAAMEVDKQGLRNEFDAWLEKQIDNLGYEERLFAGYTPAGNRRYLPNTLENASRLMNRESDVNAYDNTCLSATRAALMYKMQSLDDIRKHRDLLQKGDGYDESYKEMSDKMLDVAHRLSDMQVISDNTFMNTDYAILRMQEAFTKKDPIGYLNKEYGYSIDKDSEFATDMLTFMDEVKDMPVKYFETKFKRPVMLDEFEVAVVPDNVDADVRKALEDAGLTVVDYEHGNEESRHEAAMNAVRGREGIMFQKAGTYTTKDGVQLSMMSLFEEGNLNDNANLNERSSANGDLTELRLRKLEPSETCHVERRYEENKSFSFTGKEKIESMDDVAYIFKQLENAVVENSFIALVKDGKPIIIHTGMGGYTSSPVDIRQAVAAYMSINPEQVYFVHNHPSGSLRASKDDRLTLNLLREVFGNDVMQDGIIIDTTSGKYGVFGPEIGEGEFGWGLGEKNRGEVPMKVYEFSKQVFSKDWKPQTAYTIAGSEGVAEFISSHRLGKHPKMSFIIVNNRGQVVGNFFLPWTALSEIEDVKATCTELSNYINLAGGTKGIIYGNYQYSEKDKRMLQQLAAGMNVLRTPLLDVVHVDVNDELGYHSAHDSGVMEPEAEYVTPEREAGESILDYAKRVADDYSAYESIVKALEVANGGVMEAHDDSVSDIMDDQSMGMQERMTAMAIKIAALHADDAAAKNRAYRAIGGNLAALRKAMSLQKEFDRSTVKRVADLARWLLSGGYLDKLSRYEVGRLLSAVKNATGKTDIRPDIKKVMDIMVDNQLKRAEDLFNQFETVKAKKVNAKGVEVIGELDIAGQQIVEAFKKGRKLDKDNIEQKIADAQQRMGSDNKTIADEAANEYTGLQFALEYAQIIKDSVDEEHDLLDELEQARLDARSHDGVFADKEAYDQYRASVEEALRQNRVERLQAYLDLAGRLSGNLSQSIANAMEFKEAEKERIADIQHNANSDMEGRPSNEHYTPDWKAKVANNPFAQFFLQPLATFDQMLRLFGSKSANGEGYLYNRFMRGWVDARQQEIRGVRQKYATLDAKVKQLFGKDASNMADLIRNIGNMPKIKVQFWNGGAMRDHTLTQGNLMYIYMVDKMDDGRLKLRAMGVKEADVAKITRALDPRLIELADWLQDEFLVETRNEYNETHKRLFGASMAAIDKYFPLKILANARADKPEDLDNPNFNEGVSTTTGSIIKRRCNALALDVLNSNALNVVLDHVAQMEHWNAFAEFNRDLNTLRTYKRFRNQVQNMTTIYGSGKELWKKFNDVSQMAAGSYRPPRATLDEAAVNIAKGVTAAKVSFRVFTALKQFLSMPAYIPDARPDLWAKNLTTPWNSWSWAMDNLPIFEERWKSRMAGDPRLLKSELDWKGWRNNLVQMASRIGMAPNAFVDALTVSIGAKTIYETRRARYLKEGYSEEQADQRARQDAEIAYNETQQSSEGAFLSPMQVDRSWLSVMFTVFRNSSMAYQRQLHDALRNLKRDLKKGNREQSIEFMAKQLHRDGLSEDKAQSVAKNRYNRQIGKDILRVATFGYILQLAWNLGAKLPYLLFGDDDDKKKEMMDDVWAQSMFGWGEGISGGDVFSQGGMMLVQGKGNPEYLMKEMPIASDAKDVLQEIGQGKYGEVVNDLVNLVVQAGIGVNPQSITDAVLAIMDACGNDPALAHEATIAVMRILQVPQSQIKEMYFDELGLSGSEVSNYTPQQLVERYAQYQVKRGRLLAPWMWNDKALLGKEEKKAAKAVKERVEKVGSEYDEALADYEAKYNEVKESIDTAYEAAKQERDYVKKAQIIAEVRRADEQAFELYDDYKKYDKQLYDIVAQYLAAETPDQAALAKDDLLGFKSRMVDLLGTADEKQRRKLRFQLDEYYRDFKKEYEVLKTE